MPKTSRYVFAKKVSKSTSIVRSGVLPFRLVAAPMVPFPVPLAVSPFPATVVLVLLVVNAGFASEASEDGP